MDFPTNAFLGMTRLGKEESKKLEGAQFLVLTGIKGFPIVTMKCDLSNYPRCSYQYNCFGDINKAENSSGIYFDQKNKRVVLSSADERAVKIFKYNSCYDIKYERTIELPKKLPKISDLMIDDESKLWTGFKNKDQYSSAILVRWSKKLF